MIFYKKVLRLLWQRQKRLPFSISIQLHGTEDTFPNLVLCHRRPEPQHFHPYLSMSTQPFSFNSTPSLCKSSRCSGKNGASRPA